MASTNSTASSNSRSAQPRSSAATRRTKASAPKATAAKATAAEATEPKATAAKATEVDTSLSEANTKTVYGRNGSPTITVAMPFSKIQVVEETPRAVSLREVLELVQRLAAAAAQPRSGGHDELEAVAAAAGELLKKLDR